MKVDREKLRAEIKWVNDARGTAGQVAFNAQLVQLMEAGKWAEARAHQGRASPDRATQLYSLAASLRGRLHVQRRWEPTCDSTGCLKLVVKTMADQEALVADLAHQFALPEPQVQAA